MQLSSLVLSATALLAGAASGFFLVSDQPELSDLRAAKIDFIRGIPAPVGFYSSLALPPADINLVGSGEILSPFVLRNTNSGEWLLSSQGGQHNPNDITGPFHLDGDHYLVYEGENGGVWNACRSGAGHDIYLSTAPMHREGCIAGITLRAEY
ncbi:hypothetical protein C8A00DRAFT_37813 [Chaetomidium leptoderma]|uniref:Uncharacterized protein n=1 Tax=Chaetomidium leptoderma TaxID=669021 RepID=A0AAN6ZRX4_9PEZI|nr:hypothetical protein C8A00DRAFT_37813 [Chaetomidium leptoderma]